MYFSFPFLSFFLSPTAKTSGRIYTIYRPTSNDVVSPKEVYFGVLMTIEKKHCLGYLPKHPKVGVVRFIVAEVLVGQDQILRRVVVVEGLLLRGSPVRQRQGSPSDRRR